MQITFIGTSKFTHACIQHMKLHILVEWNILEHCEEVLFEQSLDVRCSERDHRIRLKEHPETFEVTLAEDI